MKSIGLTGGIGSGKSTVAALLVQHGVRLIDTDAIARAIAGPGGPAIEALRAEFGDSAIDGAGGLDRARMRALAFGDMQVRRRLEAILHPMIKLEVARLEADAGDAVVLFDVPLLAESSHWRSRVDRVLVVDCEEGTQLERVVRRSGWDRALAEQVIAQQAPRSRRRACADAVLYNEGLTLEELASQVHALWRRWHAGA